MDQEIALPQQTKGAPRLGYVMHAVVYQNESLK
jgi:hypothetical protein